MMNGQAAIIDNNGMDVNDVLSVVLESSGVTEEHSLADTTMIASDTETELEDLLETAERKKQADEVSQSNENVNQTTNQTSSISSNQADLQNQPVHETEPAAQNSGNVTPQSSDQSEKVSQQLSQQSGNVSNRDSEQSNEEDVDINHDDESDSDASTFSVHSAKHQNLRMVSSSHFKDNSFI